jgi:hypothetical protein
MQTQPGLRLYSPRKTEKLVLVCPEHRLVLLQIERREDEVKMHDDILGLVSDDDEEASALFGYSVSNKRGNARITVS